MPLTAKCKSSTPLRLETWFKVSQRSAVLSGQRGCLEDGKQRGRQEKMSEKGLQKAYKHSLQPHDLALLRAPEFGNNSETKTEE